jgi:hypothetical protein
VWRWLSEDAICLWAHRCWIFPRDPTFEEKAARVLDLYEGRWDGKPLDAADCVLSTDEKTSIQARKRIHPTLPPAPGRAMRVEHEYERKGAWAYFAAWDVRRAKIYGRCERKTGSAPFERLVEQVMGQEPYRSAPCSRPPPMLPSLVCCEAGPAVAGGTNWRPITYARPMLPPNANWGRMTFRPHGRVIMVRAARGALRRFRSSTGSRPRRRGCALPHPSRMLVAHGKNRAAPEVWP